MNLDTHCVARESAPHPASVTAARGEKPTFGLRRLLFSFVWLLLAVPGAWAQVPPTVVNPTSTSVTITSAVLGGEVTSDGGAPILERGVVFSVTATNADPVFGAVGATRVKADAATGVFTVQVAGLDAETGYSYKAYAINSAGTVWSAVGTFSTLAVGTGGLRASLTGAAVSNVTSDSATISATAGSSAGRFKGAVYSEAAVNSLPSSVGTGVTQQVFPGTGDGSFQIAATGLERNTQYAARVFISAPSGSGAFGIQPLSALVFTTLGAPIVTTPTSADVTGTGATLGGTVASDGGFTERGVVYALTSVNGNPEIGGVGVVQVPVAGTDIGVFTAPVSGLTTGASYSFKAYAINADGTGYSEVGTFTVAATIVVTTADDTVADDGLTSLREAVTQANSLGGANKIKFSDGTGGTVNFHDATPETITLGGTQLDITSDITIQGPGAEKLTVSGNNASRIFRNETASLTVSGLTLTQGNGNGDSGGAILSTRNLSMTDCRLTMNSAPTFRNGGAIRQTGGTLELIRCTFSGNVAPSTGGAIFGVGVTVQIVDCHFSGSRTNFSGGALSLVSGASGSIRGTTFDDNEAGDGGGAIYSQDGFFQVRNCTFTGNRSSTTGGAIYVLGFTAGGNFEMVNCTVAGNTATAGGAIVADHAGNSPTVSLHNTIISGNSTPELTKDATATFTSLGYNLCSDGGGGDAATGPGGLLNATGDRRNTAALLAPLADNGGPTFTHTLLPGSPAIDAGDPAFDPNAFTPPLTTDQRGAGFPRVVAGRVDIGAVEGAQLFSVDLDGLRTNGQTTPAADFGAVTVGGSSSLTLIVAVPGGGSAVTLQGITLPAGYRINTSGSVSGGSTSSSASVTFPATIQPGGSLFIDVLFEPVAPGLHAGDLVIANDAVPNFSFAITGMGVAAEPYTVDLDGPRTDGQTDPVADFGAVPVNGSERRTLIVANPASGQPNLQIAGFTVPAGFRIPTTGAQQVSGGSVPEGTTSLPRAVPPGTSVFIDVFFEPTAPGVYGGTLGIQTNAAGDLAEFTFEVAGETPAPSITVSLDETPIQSNPEAAPVYDFGNVSVGVTSAPVEFVIGNDGTAPLNITGIRVTLFSEDPTPDFSLTSEGLPITIEPEGEVVDTSVFSVVFHPTAVDSFFAIVTIETDDPNQPAFTFPIAGTGIAGGGGLPTQDDYFFANRLRVELDVLDNDEGTGLGLDVVTQPVPAGSTSIFANRVRFTPAAPLTGPVTFNYSASSLPGGGAATPRQVIVRPYADAAGTYVGLLLRADGSVRGRIVMTANGLGTLTAKLRYEGRTHSCISNVNATVLNIPGVAPAPRPIRLTRLTPDSLNQPVFGLRMPDSVPGEFLTCVAERSPYRPGNPTPQAGRYTMVAETTATDVPNPAAMMTCTVSADGTVKFGGRLGNGVTITQAGKLLNGGRLPFYVSTGSNATLQRISGVQLFDRTTSPAVTGTLNWQVPAGADARIPGGLSQDYELFGLPYTAAASGVTMFTPSSPSATLTLTPTISATLSLAGSPTSSGIQKISGVGTALGTGHLSVQPATGFFNGVRVIPGTRTTQRFHGVVLQGGGVNEGRGTLTTTQILTITLKP